MLSQMDYHYFVEQQIICIDMKSFYASCAAVVYGLDPLTTYLAVVADVKRKGSVVLAATPSLKRDFGIRTGSRLFEIPNDKRIILVSAQMNMYLQVSTEITRLFHKYVPKESIHTYSIDESFLDVSGVKHIFGDVETIAHLIREELKDTFGLTATIGIGSNMLLAKLCLDLEAKEQGVARWTYEDVPTKLWPITPLSKMWGIGLSLEKKLNRMGVFTVGQLANFPLKQLEKSFGVIGSQLYYHANGIDLSKLEDSILEEQISYGKSQILLQDYLHIDDISYVILELCEEVARRARCNKKVGKTVVLGVSYSKKVGGGFQRSFTLHTATNITMEIYRTCLYLFKKFYRSQPVRQLSVSLQNLSDDISTQLQLFSTSRVRERKLGYVMDEVRENYRQGALLRAVSFTNAGTFRTRGERIGGHYAK